MDVTKLTEELIKESVGIVYVDKMGELRRIYNSVISSKMASGSFDRAWNEAIGLACIYTLGFKEGAKNGD